ncbi:FAD-dependent monooxygenase [Streptomyces sp. NPDC020607]|uniref:FAD-dependent monooxygenase n=1 Tax=Streptomyces sp. NPDC020607 TaxID=3365082 RepID=UPI00378D8C03
MSQDARGVDGSEGRSHAVVIGAGPAGLTAARALANSMDHVTVIERDRLPHGAARRRGVPQARHTHSLTTTAQQGLEELFPGIGADFARAGAVRIGLSQDALVLGPAGWLPRFDAGLSMLSASRDLIDAVLRARLHAEPKVTFLAGHEVQGLQPGRNDTVTGVWTRRRERPGPHGHGPRRLIPADFVVDASGHTSRAPHWLADLGYEPPRETAVPARTTYASTVFAPPIGHVADWQSLLLLAAPGHPRQGTLNVIEGGRLALTLTFADGTPPPTDHAGLLHAAGLLRHPLLRDVIESATPLGPVYTCTRTENRWRHYDQLRRWPDQFLVVGDALAVTDPAHGQGMTHAVQSALVLDGMLSGHGTTVGLAYRLRRALVHRLAPAWHTSTRHLHTTGPAPVPPPPSTPETPPAPASASTAAAPGPTDAAGTPGPPAAAATPGTASTAGPEAAPGAGAVPATPGAAVAPGPANTTAAPGHPAGAAGLPGPARAPGSGAAGTEAVPDAAAAPGAASTADAASATGTASTAGPEATPGAGAVPGTPGAAAAPDPASTAAAPGRPIGPAGPAGAAGPPGLAGTPSPATAPGLADMPGPGAARAAGTEVAPSPAGTPRPAPAQGRPRGLRAWLARRGTARIAAEAGAVTEPHATAPAPGPTGTATAPGPAVGAAALTSAGAAATPADTPRPAVAPAQDRPRGPRAWLARRVTARIAAEAVTEPHAAARLLARLQAAGPLAVVPHPRARDRRRAPAPPPVPAPPSITHGAHARRRRAPAPAVPAIGVAAGSARLHPAGSSAQWPAPAQAPAGERHRP